MYIFIAGATSTGKSNIANFISKELNGEILSCDASQVYKHMDIGTNKNRDLETKQHLIDLIEPDQDFTVVDYKRCSNIVLNDLKKINITPIITGGTGFYMDTYLYDQEYGATTINQEEIKKSIEYDLKTKGAIYLYDELKKFDPITAKKTHPNNIRRVIRYLTIVKSGKKPSTLSKTFKLKKENYLFFILTSSINLINEKILKRIHIMIDLGLKEEVEKLLNLGYSFKLKLMQAIGYKEWEPFFYEKTEIDTVIEQININTRQYAKKQRTWFNNQYKNISNVYYIDIEDNPHEQILDLIHKKGNTND